MTTDHMVETLSWHVFRGNTYWSEEGRVHTAACDCGWAIVEPYGSGVLARMEWARHAVERMSLHGKRTGGELKEAIWQIDEGLGRFMTEHDDMQGDTAVVYMAHRVAAGLKILRRLEGIEP